MMNGQMIKTVESACECRNIAMNTAKTVVTTKTKTCNPISPIGTMLEYSTSQPRGKTNEL